MTDGISRAFDDKLEQLDIFDQEVADDFYPVTHEARRRCPIGHTDANGGHWYVTTLEPAREVLGDTDTYSSAYGGIPGRPRTPGALPSVQSTDPPVHKDYRRILEPEFTRKTLEPHTPAVAAIAGSLIDEFVEDGRFEVMSQYVQPMTAAVIASVLCGMEWDTFRDELLGLASLKDHALSVTIHDPEDGRRAQRAMATRFVRERQTSGIAVDDVLDALLHGQVAGKPLTEEEVVANLALIIGAGLDTTKSAIGSILWRLTEDPTLEDQLRSTDWARSGLDEFLRIDAPVTGMSRTVQRDTVLGGCPVAAGEKVFVIFAAANRDESVFEDPDELDFERVRNPHLTFGAGVHRCVGSNLARLQIQVAVDELLARVQSIRLEPGAEVHWTPGTIRHVVRLPLIFERRD